MTSEELREIINQTDEWTKLDFKIKPYNLSRQPPKGKSKNDWNKIINRQRDELIKDIIALTNGDVGTSEQDAFLIIGVEEKKPQNGERKLYNVKFSEEFRATSFENLETKNQ